jgi:hypothetical protein
MNQISKSYYNPKEVEICTKLIKFLVQENPTVNFYGRIGVITPYKQQTKEIKRELVRSFGGGVLKSVEVSTVDGFQGQEKDIIIFSCVRANTGTNIGFLNDFRRLNVSLTRAKYSLFILGNASLLSKNEGLWAKLILDATDRRLLIHYDASFWLNINLRGGSVSNLTTMAVQKEVKKDGKNEDKKTKKASKEVKESKKTEDNNSIRKGERIIKKKVEEIINKMSNEDIIVVEDGDSSLKDKDANEKNNPVLNTPTATRKNTFVGKEGNNSKEGSNSSGGNTPRTAATSPASSTVTLPTIDNLISPTFNKSTLKNSLNVGEIVSVKTPKSIKVISPMERRVSVEKIPRIKPAVSKVVDQKTEARTSSIGGTVESRNNGVTRSNSVSGLNSPNESPSYERRVSMVDQRNNLDQMNYNGRNAAAYNAYNPSANNSDLRNANEQRVKAQEMAMKFTNLHSRENINRPPPPPPPPGPYQNIRPYPIQRPYQPMHPVGNYTMVPVVRYSSNPNIPGVNAMSRSSGSGSGSVNGQGIRPSSGAFIQNLSVRRFMPPPT